MIRTLTLLPVALLLSFGLAAQDVNLTVEIVGLERSGYGDCVGCGSPDPTWEVVGAHNGSGGFTTYTDICYHYEEMGGTYWDRSGFGEDIISATNTSATSFDVNMHDAYEKNCNNDHHNFYNYDFFDCFPSVYGDSRRTNGVYTVNFRTASSPCTWVSGVTSWYGDYRIHFRYYWDYYDAPSITTQPAANTSLCLGSSTNLTIAVNTDPTGGHEIARNFQWQISENTDCGGATGWTDIPGATLKTYAPYQIAGTRLYRCKTTSNCSADFTSNTTISNCARVTYNPMDGSTTAPASVPYFSGDGPPAVQSGICGSTVLPGSAHTLNTLQPPNVDAVANLGSPGYDWDATGGSFSTTTASSTVWTAPTTPGSYNITLEYIDACGAANVFAPTCVVEVGSPNCDFVYVSTTGSDVPTAGGPTNPFGSISYALANRGTRTHLKVANGTYSESSIVELQTGVIIEWRATSKPAVSGRSPATRRRPSIAPVTGRRPPRR